MENARRAIKDIFRASEQASSLLSSVGRPFAIANVVGNLAPRKGWTTSLKNPPQITLDELGRSVITVSGESPVYLVAHGSDSDFKSLTKSAGIPLTGFNTVRVNSRMSSDGDVRAQVMMLEYDAQRKRIGELVTRGTSRIRGAFLPETAHVLPAIRIVGKGELTIDWMHLDATTEKVDPSAERIEQITSSSASEENSRISALKSDLAIIQEQANRISAGLDDLNLPSVGRSEVSNRRSSARDDGGISATRELLVRDLLKQMADSLPESNGSHHFEKIPASVGLIADESMFNFYKDVFRDAHYLSPDNYQDILAEHKLDAILYVTCWKGVYGEEWKGIKFREKPAQALEEILKYAKENSIPSLFQTIEDPSNFEYFLPIAKKFDYIFTSDSEMIDQYRSELGNENVTYGEYGANTSVNNPIGSTRFNFNRALFSGSYPERYPERCEDMHMVFDSIPEREDHLLIIDRNFNSPDFEFPDKYQTSIIGPFPHSVLQQIHKLFRFSLNFNSIKLSPTMCAMRVYELQAQGKPLISNYARSIFNRFPGIRILAEETTLTDFSQETSRFPELSSANDLMTDLLIDKTSFSVVSKMMKFAGLPTAPARNRTTLVVAVGELETVATTVATQIHVDATVITVEELLSPGFDLSRFGYLTAMSAELAYGPRYLASRLNAFIYTDSRFVTQYAEFSENSFSSGPIHEYVGEAYDRTKTVVSTEHPNAVDFMGGKLSQISGAGYAADPFGINYLEYDAYQSNVALVKEPRLSVIVPIYNNGRFLLTKCLPSLRRNTSWNEMEVLLIDDGSTDKTTLNICKDLAARFDNIVYFSFADGGSGSASRPRNHGVELATADLVAFLDPDNEISAGGYDTLLSEFDRLNSTNTRTDLVSGYQVKVADTVKYTGRHTVGKTRTVSDPVSEFFKAGRFPVVSTQAAVMRKEMLIAHNVRFIEKAAGQDTLYGWQVLLAAENPSFIDTAHLIYYAQRDDSVTNQVDITYFDKCLILEREQVEILKDQGIFQEYIDHQFDNFMSNWYLDRLRHVRETDRAAAVERLSHIAQLYGRNLEDYLEK